MLAYSPARRLSPLLLALVPGERQSCCSRERPFHGLFIPHFLHMQEESTPLCSAPAGAMDSNPGSPDQAAAAAAKLRAVAQKQKEKIRELQRENAQVSADWIFGLMSLGEGSLGTTVKLERQRQGHAGAPETWLVWGVGAVYAASSNH
jgi:hypothetical protein